MIYRICFAMAEIIGTWITNAKLIERREEEEAIAVIIQKLGHLPLALDHAGAYILREQCTFTSYSKELDNAAKVSFHLSKGWKQGGDKESVFASWEMSFEVLRQRVPNAADLLTVCGFLDNEDISEEFLMRGMSLEDSGMYEFLYFTVPSTPYSCNLGAYNLHLICPHLRRHYRILTKCAQFL